MQFDTVRPVPLKQELVSAVIAPGAMTKHISKILAYLAQSPEITSDDLERYLTGLLVLRVLHVRREGVDQVMYRKEWAVPDVWTVLLQQIGRAVDLDYGIEVEPDVPEDLKAVDYLWLREFSYKLWRCQDLRPYLQMVELPIDPRGNYDFMTMVIVEGDIRARSTSVHPVNAFLVSFVQMRLIEDVFSPRISYGSTRRMEPILEGLLRSDPRAILQFARNREDSEDGPSRNQKPGSKVPAPKSPNPNGRTKADAGQSRESTARSAPGD